MRVCVHVHTGTCAIVCMHICGLLADVRDRAPEVEVTNVVAWNETQVLCNISVCF